MKIKDLKKIIENLDDEMPVRIGEIVQLAGGPSAIVKSEIDTDTIENYFVLIAHGKMESLYSFTD